MTLTVYTDGSVYPNPDGIGGWGFVIKHDGSTDKVEAYGGDPCTTNNRMEMVAAINALDLISQLDQKLPVVIRSDSQYLVKTMNVWRFKWTSMEDRPNADLWDRLIELNSHLDVTWEWVKGHAGDELNEVADRLANLGRKEIAGSS